MREKKKWESHTVDEGIQFVSGDVDAGLGLGEEWNDGLARVTANNGNLQVGGVLLTDDLGDEGLGTDDIEGGDTEELLGVELASAFQHLGGDGNGGVDGIGDDEDKGIWGVVCDALDDVAHDAGVDLEQVITGHARLA